MQRKNFVVYSSNFFFFFFFYCSTKDSFLRFLTIKQDVTQGRSDSAGQMAGKKIKPVYEWYTLGSNEDRVP